MRLDANTIYTGFLASFLPCFLFGKTQSRLKDIDAGAYSYVNRDVSPFTNHKFKSQSNYSLVYLLRHFLLWMSGLFISTEASYNARAIHDPRLKFRGFSSIVLLPLLYFGTNGERDSTKLKYREW